MVKMGLIGVAGLLGALVLVVAAVAVVGLFLPRSHHATVNRVIRGTPEEVWTAITDVEAFPTWRADVRAVRRLEDRDGRTAWVEEGTGGPMTLEVTAMERPRRWVTRIADEGAPFGGTWTYELESAPGGTRVRITEDGEIYNPVFRVVARLFLGYDGTINRYLDGLQQLRGPSS